MLINLKLMGLRGNFRFAFFAYAMPIFTGLIIGKCSKACIFCQHKSDSCIYTFALIPSGGRCKFSWGLQLFIKYGNKFQNTILITFVILFNVTSSELKKEISTVVVKSIKN